MNARGHLSSESIDLLMLDALKAEESAEAKSHLETCPHCKQRWAELNEDKLRFEQFVMPRTLAKVEASLSPPKPFFERLAGSWRSLMPVAGLAAAALAAVLVSKSQTEDDVYVGTKGAARPSLEVVASRPGGEQVKVRPGSTVLHPKDRIRFVVTPGAFEYVLIASRDGAGTFTVYHPFNGAQSARLAPGAHELPGAVELDAAVGRERLVAVFSKQPVESAAVQAALAAAPEAPSVQGAEVVSWEFEKQP